MEFPPPQPSEQYRNWLDLPLEVTESILKRLGVIEILTSAQKVCLLWRNTCKDPSMWLALNMGDDLDSWDMSYDLKKMCRQAVDLSCGRLVGIEVGEFCDENLLKYIAERYDNFLKCAVYWPRKPSKECNLSAVAIAKNMPGLISLLLVGNKLSDDGVQTILEEFEKED
ncbi:F-box protein SKIP19-like [Juglans regia]|uniref:F-box protein SKIP19-like n=1 Tax=Juglans regia TaxID=51240 RepID=A0A6P9EML6_JUGRE|nr:F-box protein SKIP19-like [Juglans regia]